VHGRLYVTPNFLCFYSNIFGWETMLTIPCIDVIAIRKEKVALVVCLAVLAVQLIAGYTAACIDVGVVCV
jgi:hypothetical protein